MAKKFDAVKGVFVPSTESIPGTVPLLLLPMLTADTGLAIILIIIILAHTVTPATFFSIDDCATNLTTIGGGGFHPENTDRYSCHSGGHNRVNNPVRKSSLIACRHQKGGVKWPRLFRFSFLDKRKPDPAGQEDKQTESAQHENDVRSHPEP